MPVTEHDKQIIGRELDDIDAQLAALRTDVAGGTIGATTGLVRALAIGRAALNVVALVSKEFGEGS